MGKKIFLACLILLEAALVAVIIVIALSETAKKIAIIAPAHGHGDAGIRNI